MCIKYLVPLLSVMILLGFPGQAFSREKKSCLKNEIALKNCYLIFKGHKIQFNKNKIIYSDGIWKNIFDMPNMEKASEWSSIHIRSISNRHFVEFNIWDSPRSVLKIQSLFFYFFEIKPKVLEKKLGQIIQKKRSLDKKIIYDPKIKVKFFKNLLDKKISWEIGDSKGEF